MQASGRPGLAPTAGEGAVWRHVSFKIGWDVLQYMVQAGAAPGLAPSAWAALHRAQAADSYGCWPLWCTGSSCSGRECANHTRCGQMGPVSAALQVRAWRAQHMQSNVDKSLRLHLPSLRGQGARLRGKAWSRILTLPAATAGRPRNRGLLTAGRWDVNWSQWPCLGF